MYTPEEQDAWIAEQRALVTVSTTAVGEYAETVLDTLEVARGDAITSHIACIGADLALLSRALRLLDEFPWQKLAPDELWRLRATSVFADTRRIINDIYGDCDRAVGYLARIAKEAPCHNSNV